MSCVISYHMMHPGMTFWVCSCDPGRQQHWLGHVTVGHVCIMIVVLIGTHPSAAVCPCEVLMAPTGSHSSALIMATAQ